MKLFGKLSLVCLLLAGCFGSALAQREPVDNIAVVVGDKIILRSELANQIQMTAFQSEIDPSDEAGLLELQAQVVDRLISDRLFLIEAQKDTTISIRTEEIDQALDDHVARMTQQFGSTEAFAQALAAEGLTIRELKRRFRPEVENSIIKQRFIQRKLAEVTVSRHETQKYYEQFKDSLPVQPEAARLAHVLLTIKPSSEVEDSVKSLATELRQRILDGADFATISSQYSMAGAGVGGGDLGYIAREDVVEEFGRAAFVLSVGDISGVVRTEFGYHVIKCEGRKDERLKLRHLLLNVLPAASDTTRVMAVADSLMTALEEGSDFAEIAKAFSEDNETRAREGELGWFAIEKLPPEFASAVRGWSTPGTCRGPVVSGDGLHLVKLLEYQPTKHLNIEEDFEQVAELARQDKTGRIVDEWMAEVRDKTYIDVRLEN